MKSSPDSDFAVPGKRKPNELTTEHHPQAFRVLITGRRVF
jgi:hypothetical protein